MNHKHLLTINADNPLRVDPTRTTMIRKRFIVELNKRFRKLRSSLRDFLVIKDALGFKERRSFLTANVQPREFEFKTDAGKLDAFNDWFRQQMEADILSVGPGTPVGQPWTAQYVDSAYRRGQLNAYLSTHQARLMEEAGVRDMTQEQFLRDSFAAPEAMAKVRLLGTRSFEQLKGVTAQMSTDMNRILSQGMIDGKGPEAIAREMSTKIGSLTRARALTIARTETVYAHAEGQLDSFEQLGVKELGIKAEWSSAGDDRVCEECADMEGQVFEVDKSHGMIPLHPNCRCTWIPAFEETTEGKKIPDAGNVEASGDPDGLSAYIDQLLGAGEVDPERIYDMAKEKFPEKFPTKRTGHAWVLRTVARKKSKLGGPGVFPPAPAPVPVPVPAPVRVVPAPVSVPKSIPAPTPVPPVQEIEKGKKVARFTKYETGEDYRKALLREMESHKLSPEDIINLETMVKQRSEAFKKVLDSSLPDEIRDLNKSVYNDLSKKIIHMREKEYFYVQDARDVLKEENNLSSVAKTIATEKMYKKPIEEVLSFMPEGSISVQERNKLGNVRVYHAPGLKGQNLNGTYDKGRRISPDPVIRIAGNTGAKVAGTVAHEFGHHISYQIPRVMQGQNEYFDMRTVGDRIEKLPGYKEVVGKKDKWLEPYTGRVYEDGRAPEVIAVGVEHLYKDPVRFAQKDPEFFNRVVGWLKNIPDEPS